MTFLMPVLKTEWGLNGYEEGLIGSVLFAAMIIGSSVFGLFSDWVGRKTASVCSAILVLAGGIASVFAPSFGWMIFFRFFVGIGVGLFKKNQNFLDLVLTSS